MRTAFEQHAITQQLAPHVLAEWHAWANDRVKAFQRASSAVEGRNGFLSQMHHNQRGLPKRRYKVWTCCITLIVPSEARQSEERGIRAQLPKRVWKSKKNRGRPIKKVVPRFQAEQTFAWFQKKYRRLVVRWERIAACFEAFLAIATIHIWISRLIVG